MLCQKPLSPFLLWLNFLSATEIFLIDWLHNPSFSSLYFLCLSSSLSVDYKPSEGISHVLFHLISHKAPGRAPLGAQMVKNLPIMRKNQVPSLGQEVPLEKGWLPTLVFLPVFLEDFMDRGAWWAIVHGLTKSQTWLSDYSWKLHNLVLTLMSRMKTAVFCLVACAHTHTHDLTHTCIHIYNHTRTQAYVHMHTHLCIWLMNGWYRSRKLLFSH